MDPTSVVHARPSHPTLPAGFPISPSEPMQEEADKWPVSHAFCLHPSTNMQREPPRCNFQLQQGSAWHPFSPTPSKEGFPTAPLAVQGLALPSPHTGLWWTPHIPLLLRTTCELCCPPVGRFKCLYGAPKGCWLANEAEGVPHHRWAVLTASPLQPTIPPHWQVQWHTSRGVPAPPRAASPTWEFRLSPAVF